MWNMWSDGGKDGKYVKAKKSQELVESASVAVEPGTSVYKR